VGDKVFLKVSPVKGVRRFNLKGRLSPRYIGPYEVIKRLNRVAYISQLRKYVLDPNHIIIAEPVEVAENLRCEERPM